MKITNTTMVLLLLLTTEYFRVLSFSLYYTKAKNHVPDTNK